MFASDSVAPLAYEAPQQFRPTETGIPPKEKSGGSATHHSAKRRRALVVDDVVDVTDMLEVFLTHAGYDVSTASSAADAIALAETDRFDVVISDIGMPVMDGYDLVKNLRTLDGYQSVPMVAVTGYTMFNDRERSLKSGFNAHMSKPIDPQALLDLIEQL